VSPRHAVLLQIHTIIINAGKPLHDVTTQKTAIVKSHTKYHLSLSIGEMFHALEPTGKNRKKTHEERKLHRENLKSHRETEVLSF
jgi:hypothetical protein